MTLFTGGLAPVVSAAISDMSLLSDGRGKRARRTFYKPSIQRIWLFELKQTRFGFAIASLEACHS